MNIADSEAPYEIEAKTCGCTRGNRKIAYTFVDTYHGICKDKKEIITSEIQACERLKGYAIDEADRNVIEAEISELKMALDLLP
jgi:hypothetical protein